MSVVIPALNEEQYLPALLDSLTRQTHPVHELIVADASSTDRTRSIAADAGARIVKGGLPGLGRNLGAAEATGIWLLFVDADVVLPDTAICEAIRTMHDRGLDSASCWFVPDSRDPLLRFNHWLSSQYFRVSSRLGWPHSIGAFLLVRRAKHEEIGGFDTTIRVAEDQDYVRRLAGAGRYAFLRRPVVRIATRRFETEGSLWMSVKWLGIELHRLVIGEIRGDYFRYFKARRP